MLALLTAHYSACGSGWTLLNGKCAQRFGKDPGPTRLSWYGAHDDCVARGANLASVETIDELKALATFCWEGVTLPDVDADCALGLKRTTPNTGDWMWTDGTAFSQELQDQDQSSCCYHFNQHAHNKVDEMHMEGEC